MGSFLYNSRVRNKDDDDEDVRNEKRKRNYLRNKSSLFFPVAIC